MNYALKITGLKKRYGKNTALDGLNMEVPENTVYGFLGENGAGKTTTFSILGGFLSADAGEFKMQGKMAMLPQDARFGVGRKIGSQLRLLAHLSGVGKAESKQEVKRVLKEVSMEAHENLAIDKCSHGMYKRIGIAQTLLGNPDLLLFDEPTSGLDPKNAHDIRQLITKLNHHKTVVISSHNLNEIEQMCAIVGIINRGKMVYEGPVKDLVGQSSVINLELAEEPHVLNLKTLKAIKKVEWSKEEHLCQIEFDKSLLSLEEMNALILDYLLKNKIGIRSIRSGRGLEQEYLKQLGMN